MIGAAIGGWIGWTKGPRGVVVFVLVSVGVVMLLASAAPHETHRPATPDQLARIPSRDACYPYGTVVRAVQTEDNGEYGQIFDVTCSSGVKTTYALVP
jgi:hypothetical protein